MSVYVLNDVCTVIIIFMLLGVKDQGLKMV